MLSLGAERLNNMIKGKVVLIIDRDEAVHAALRELLEEHGCFIVCSPNILEGVHMVQEVAFDVLMVDTALPGLTPEVSARTLRERCPRAQIIGMCSSDDDRVPTGADAVIRKPIDPEVLLPLIQGQ